MNAREFGFNCFTIYSKYVPRDRVISADDQGPLPSLWRALHDTGYGAGTLNRAAM